MLISGDQVLPKISPNVSRQAHEPDGDPLAALSCLARQITGSGSARSAGAAVAQFAVFRSAARIDELAAHHQARCEEILAACVTPQSAVDLLPLLFRRPLDRHQTAFALGEAFAHLHYLMVQGALDRVLGSDGVYRFVGASG